MNDKPKTAAQMQAIIEQVSESLAIELALLKSGEVSMNQYTAKVSQWMRLLADSTGTERGQWEVQG